MKKLYIIDTVDNTILDKIENLKNNWGCDSVQILVRAVYEAEDNPTATQLSDLIDPIDVTSKRIYLVE